MFPTDITPSAAEAVQHVKTQGYQAATNVLNEMGMIESDANTLTIGRGTAVQLVIHRTPKGEITPQGQLDGILPLLLPDTPGQTRFDALHRAFKRRAKNAVLMDIIIHLGIPAEPDETDNQSPHHLLKDPTVKRAISRTAAKAVKDRFPNTKHRDQAQEAYSTLHQFITNPIVLQATKVAGQAATLHDLSTFLKHRKKLINAARRNPNATILWMAIRPSIAKLSPPSSAKDIIETAKSAFTCDCSHTMQTRFNDLRNTTVTKGENTSSKGLSHAAILEHLWNTFINLDTHTLGRSRNRSLQRITTLCKRIAAAGVHPSPHAVLHILDNPHIPLEEDSLLLTLYIQASATCPEDQQDTLAFQFEALTKYNTLYIPKRNAGHFNPRGLTQALKEGSTHPATNWQELMKLAPQWLRDAKGTTQDRKLLPNPKYMVLTHDTAEKAATGTLGDDLRLVYEESITVHTIPGKTTAMFPTCPEKPILLVTKKPDGTINMDQQTTAMLHITTGTTHTERAEDRREQIPSPENKVFSYRQTNIAHVHNNLTSNAAWNLLLPRWEQVSGHTNKTKPGFHHDVNLIITKALRCAASTPPSPDDIAHSIAQGVRLMVDPSTWARANPAEAHRDTTTLFNYNAAASLGEKLDQLVLTNPGATTWVFEKERTPERINHPGQLISLAKQHLLKAGLHPASWKFAATLDAPLMQILAANTNTARSTEILNNLAQAGAKPAPPIMSLMTAFWIPRNKHDSPNDGLVRRNEGLVIRLLARESAARLEQDPTMASQTALRSQVRDVTDFINLLNNQHTLLESTTWRGLARRSHEWHKQSTRESANERWQQALEERGGAYLAWESALDAVKIEEHTVTPLNNEKLLHEESARMGHCVYSYADRCAKGTSRIFSISKDGRKLATAEIIWNGTAWRPAQTRAQENHDAQTTVHNIMTTIAMTYTQHYKERKTKPEPSWQVNDPTVQLSLEAP